MQDDIFIFTYGRKYIKVRSLKVRWRMLSLVHYNSNMNSQSINKVKERCLRKQREQCESASQYEIVSK